MRRSKSGYSVSEELEVVPPSKLSIENVSKSFKTATGVVQALEGVNMQVGEGEFVCIVGANGCGKSTLLNIIAGLEKSKRGFYAGAVGYFGFDGKLNSCIALRSVVLQGGQAYVQAGAGIVADSDPASEYQETINKAKAVLEAIARANASAP